MSAAQASPNPPVAASSGDHGAPSAGEPPLLCALRSSADAGHRAPEMVAVVFLRAQPRPPCTADARARVSSLLRAAHALPQGSGWPGQLLLAHYLACRCCFCYSCLLLVFRDVDA